MGVLGGETKYNHEIKYIKIYSDHYPVLPCERVWDSMGTTSYITGIESELQMFNFHI
jgi:hypothetical protein